MDLIMSQPWQCGSVDDCGVPGGWHLARYYINHEVGGNPYLLDDYGDGCDTDGIQEKDLPEPREIESSWRDYYLWVADNCADPLGELIVDLSTKEMQNWVVCYGRNGDIIGLTAIGPGQIKFEAEMPIEIAEWCLCAWNDEVGMFLYDRDIHGEATLESLGDMAEDSPEVTGVQRCGEDHLVIGLELVVTTPLPEGEQRKIIQDAAGSALRNLK